ncbi:hypothetical protein [Treponema maltophilum]|uniref:hypothetical protein n=1 Tax=Treponema maltophilum TaxID=51160 RepID=UPI003D93A24E
MKEPVTLYTLDRLEYSQEILLYKEPKELSLTIWIIVSLFVAALCWVIFGKMEETVRSRGVVRPVSNISQVKNAVSGEITGLYYRPGERFQGYNVASNSCGITARDVLTVPGSGISKVTTMRLGLFWGVSPTGIGDLLWMRNHGIADRYDIPPISVEGGLK